MFRRVKTFENENRIKRGVGEGGDAKPRVSQFAEGTRRTLPGYQKTWASAKNLDTSPSGGKNTLLEETKTPGQVKKMFEEFFVIGLDQKSLQDLKHDRKRFAFFFYLFSRMFHQPQTLYMYPNLTQNNSW